MLAAAVVLALALGFAASFGTELKRPHIADSREAEQVSGARVLTVVQAAGSRRRAKSAAGGCRGSAAHRCRLRELPHSLPPHRRGRCERADRHDHRRRSRRSSRPLPPISPRRRRTKRAARCSSMSIRPPAASPACCASGPIPGLSGIITGAATWPEAIVPTTIGRDRPLDVLPSGTRRAGPARARRSSAKCGTSWRECSDATTSSSSRRRRATCSEARRASSRLRT